LGSGEQNQWKHFKSRVKERLGIDNLTFDECLRIIADIQCGNGQLIKKLSSYRRVYRVKLRDVIADVIYNNRYKNFVTVFPAQWNKFGGIDRSD